MSPTPPLNPAPPTWKKARLGQLEAAKALPSAYLREVFEGPDAQRWPTCLLSELLSVPLKTGISKPGSPWADKLCLTLSSVRAGSLDFTRVKPADVADSAAEGCWVRPDAFYVVRGNGNRALVGRGALAPESVPRILFPDLLIQVITDPARLLPRFLRLAWDSPRVRAEIESRARTSAGIFKINQANLGTLRIPSPPVALQEGLIEKLERKMAMAYQMQGLISSEVSLMEHLVSGDLRTTLDGGR
jgi:type I restriction enzyme S subunit